MTFPTPPLFDAALAEPVIISGYETYPAETRRRIGYRMVQTS